MLIQLGSVSILFTLINKVLSVNGGTLGINTFAYISKIISFAVVPFNAVATAVSPIISYNYGFGSHKRTKKAVNSSIIICEIYTIIGMLIAFTLSANILKIFTDNNEMINQGADALKTLALSMPFLPVILTFGTYFQATEQKSKAFLTNSLLLIFSFVLILIFVNILGTNSIYSAVSAACLLSCILSVILMKNGASKTTHPVK